MTSIDDRWKAPDDAELDTFLRGARGGTALAALGTLVFIAAIVFSFVRLRDVDEEIAQKQAQIDEQVATLARQEAEIKENEERIATLAPAALRGFGWESASGAPTTIEPAAVQASLEAHDAVTRIATARPRLAAGQKVVYYAKSATVDANQDNLIASLRDLGFTVEVVRPVNPIRSSNALWYGSDVDPAAVELVGQALIRAGYKLQNVRPFEDTARKRDLIEIGASPQSVTRPGITSATLPTVLRRVRQ